MKLLIDIGNTRLKWAWASAGRLTSHGGVVHLGQLPEAFQEVLAVSPTPESVWVSSVAKPAINQALTEYVEQQWGLACYFLESPQEGQGVRNAYTQPATLGPDRWAAMVGVNAQGLLPACIVDCGTAVTVDLLDHLGHHQGGLIFAGLTMSRQALDQATYHLTVPDEGAMLQFARDTATAIRAGTQQALRGAVESCFQQAAEALGQPPHLVITGGDGEWLVHALAQHEAHWQPDLVLQGLAAMEETG